MHRAYTVWRTTTKFHVITHMGRGVVLGGQQRHCICTNASRGLSAIAEFLVLFSRDRTSFSPNEAVRGISALQDREERERQPEEGKNWKRCFRLLSDVNYNCQVHDRSRNDHWCSWERLQGLVIYWTSVPQVHYYYLRQGGCFTVVCAGVW